MFANALLMIALCMGIVAQVSSQECLTGTQDFCRPNINKQCEYALSLFSLRCHRSTQLQGYIFMVKSFDNKNKLTKN